MTTNHTPGPWRVVPCGGISTAIQRDACMPWGAAVIATVAHSDRDQEAATARLIAAAPAMLAILERILYAHDTGNCGLSNGEAVLCRSYAEQARAAIAQAEEGGR
jgi:hypothetical protein